VPNFGFDISIILYQIKRESGEKPELYPQL